MSNNGLCSYNKAIDCMENKCNRCGWNPEVAKERIKDWEINRRAEKNNKK